MTNIRRETRCYLCGANITNPNDDWQLRLVRTEPRLVEFGDLTGWEYGHIGHGSWHLCKKCSDIAALVIRRKLDTFRSEVNL